MYYKQHILYPYVDQCIYEYTHRHSCLPAAAEDEKGCLVGGSLAEAASPGCSRTDGHGFRFPPVVSGSLAAGTERSEGWLYAGTGKRNVAENQGV